MERGKFIVLEGGEGSGKSVMMERLRAEFLRGTVFTRDPGGVSLGEETRRLVLSADARGIDAGAELLLFLAARAQLIAELIAPALQEGKHVICDRFILSTIAYQVYGRQKQEYLPLVKSTFAAISRGCMPDVTIFLDVTPEIGLQRVHLRMQAANRFDDEGLPFHELIRQGYKKHIGEYGRPVIIDASKPLEEVWTDVKNAVQSALSISV